MTVRGAEEGDRLILAFRRFIELHGRGLVDPRARCSFARLADQAGETLILTFWSARAAAAFDRFWSRYEPLYAAAAPVPARRAGRMGAAASH